MTRHDSVFDALDFSKRDDADDPILLLDIDGFSGPLDLLLELARRQKVDLHRISVLALVEQYLAFIEQVRSLRLELAADYLVMAAWLAYLKSRLLLPQKQDEDEPDAAMLAASLALRLQKLETIRRAAKLLQQRPQLGRDIFPRGAPEPVALKKSLAWEANICDLLSAYAQQRQTKALSRVSFAKRFVWSLPEARAALERLVGTALTWTELDAYLMTYAVEPSEQRTVRASAFSATLELVKEGRAEIRQDGAFAKIFMKQSSRPPEGRR